MTPQRNAEEHDYQPPRARWALTKGALNITDAAYYMSLRERMLMDMANKGEIPYVKIGRDYLFIPDQLDEWLKHHATMPPTDSAITPTRPSRPRQEDGDLRTAEVLVQSAPLRRGPIRRRLLG